MKFKMLLNWFFALLIMSCNISNNSKNNDELVIYGTIEKFIENIKSNNFEEAISMFPYGNLGISNSEFHSLMNDIADGVHGKEIPPIQNLKYEYIKANNYETSYYVVTMKFCGNSNDLDCFELMFTFGNSVGYNVITSVSIMPNTRINEMLK